jgi:hypothetical protein
MVVKCVRQYLPSCDVELIFNFDEVGILPSEDRVPRNLIVAVSIAHHTTSHGVSSNLKSGRVICCVQVSGKSMTLFRVASQADELATKKQKVERCRIGMNLILAHRQKPYVSAALFQQSRTIVLIQFIDSPPINDEFALKPVTLLMDDFDVARRSNVFPTLKENYLRVIFFPA